MRFAYDIALVSITNILEEIEEKANTSIRKCRAWIDQAGLPIASHKTEAVLMISRKVAETMKRVASDSTRESKKQIKLKRLY